MTHSTINTPIADATTSPNTLRDFLDVLFEPDDLIELRPLRHDCKRNPPQRWLKPVEIAELDLIQINADASVYFGASPRKREGGSADDVALHRCVYVDFDDGMTWERARDIIDEAGLPFPSAVLNSGGGVHVYWRLEYPIEDNETFTSIQKGLISLLDSDGKVHDPPRVMRLPGTVNRKPERNGARCELIDFNYDRHDIEDIVRRFSLPAVPKAKQDDKPVNGDEARRMALGKMLAVKVEDKRDGSNRMLAYAREGVVAGLDDDAIIALIREAEHFAPFPVPYSKPEIQRRIDDARKKNKPKPKERRLIMRAGNTIDDAGIEYLWRRRIARGGPTIIFSRPGAGKSTIAADFTGNVTTGKPWPDGAPCEAGSVIYIKGEGTDASIRDRMKNAGADPEKYHIIGRAEVDDDSDESPMIDLGGDDANLLAHSIRMIGDVKLVIVDTLDSLYPSMRMIDNGHIRKCLWPLQEIAAEFNVALVILAHTNKGGYHDPLDRLSGGRAIGGAARAVWYLGKPDMDAEGFAMAPVKVNDFKPEPPIEYSIVGIGPDSPGAIRWGQVNSDIRAWDLDRPPKEAQTGTKSEQCAEWMQERLANGPEIAGEFNHACKLAGYGEDARTKARHSLSIKTKSAKGQCPPVHYVCLPGQEPPQPLKTPDPPGLDSEQLSNGGVVKRSNERPGNLTGLLMQVGGEA